MACRCNPRIRFARSHRKASSRNAGMGTFISPSLARPIRILAAKFTTIAHSAAGPSFASNSPPCSTERKRKPQPRKKSEKPECSPPKSSISSPPWGTRVTTEPSPCAARVFLPRPWIPPPRQRDSARSCEPPWKNSIDFSTWISELHDRPEPLQRKSWRRCLALRITRRS